MGQSKFLAIELKYTFIRKTQLKSFIGKKKTLKIILSVFFLIWQKMTYKKRAVVAKIKP